MENEKNDTTANVPTVASDCEVTAPVAAPDQEKLNAHPATLKQLSAIEDPLDRFVKASEICSLSQRLSPTMVELRARRRRAVIALNEVHGWGKAEIARHIGAPDRRVVDYAFKPPARLEADRKAIPEEWKTSPDGTPEGWKAAQARAATTAKRTHREYLKREAMGETAREVRRVLIQDLTQPGGMYGQRYKPSYLASLTGYTTALVSQNRTGSSNRKKMADRAEARRLKAEAEGHKTPEEAEAA